MNCPTCDQLAALRERYIAAAERLRRIADKQKARAAADDSYRRPRGRPPEFPRLRYQDVCVAADWLDAHRRLPVTERDAHPGASDSVTELWAELSSVSDRRYWQPRFPRRRRLAVRLVALLAGCSERTARAAIREDLERSADPERPEWPLPPPHLEWGPDRTPEWIVGRPPTDKERKTARRSRHDPDPTIRRLWDWEGEFVAGFGLTDESAMILAGGLEELLRYYEACGHGDGHPGGIERGCETCLEVATIKRFLNTPAADSSARAGPTA